MQWINKHSVITKCFEQYIKRKRRSRFSTPLFLTIIITINLVSNKHVLLTEQMV
jgi:hypothetical protein